jgi:hypothetical protein
MNYGFTDTSNAASAKVEPGTGDKKGNSEEQLGMKRKGGPQEPSEFVFYNLLIFSWGVAESTRQVNNTITGSLSVTFKV